MGALEALLIYAIEVGIVAGLIYWGVSLLPIAPAQLKQAILYAIIILAVVLVLFRALPLLGVAT